MSLIDYLYPYRFYGTKHRIKRDEDCRIITKFKGRKCIIETLHINDGDRRFHTFVSLLRKKR